MKINPGYIARNGFREVPKKRPVRPQPGLATAVFLALTIWGLMPERGLAGGGPENVVLVVNADSASSKLLANHYIAERQIPSRNVIYLNEVPDREKTDLKTFKEKILRPVFEQINQRKLAHSVDYIVYSADFPTAINISDHTKLLNEQLKKQGRSLPGKIYSATASITSLTYFGLAVLADQPGYILLDSNTYYRQPAAAVLRQPFAGPVQEKFREAIDLFDAGTPDDYDQAIRTLESLAKQNPQQVAVSYWLARFYARRGKSQSAIRWLTIAIRSGWCYRKYTKADLAFRKIEDEPLFEGIVNRIPQETFDFAPTRGFKHAYAWAPNGMLNKEPGQGNRYFLSTMLGVTRNYGNTETEALRQLKNTMPTDSTFPKGTFYFADTGDVRNRTRKPHYAKTIESLEQLGHQAEVVTAKLPFQEKDVMGLAIGTSSFNWLASGSKILPGAICDNLTSHGGKLYGAGQTKLSELLKNGAAGSGGTVTEPFSILAKFPHPNIHVHYVKGCSLAEAFYQAIHGPFQYLIVGDPLCQPWAQRPEFTLAGIEPGDTISGNVEIALTEKISGDVPIAGIEFYVDGVLVLRSPFRSKINFDTSGISDGYHELRLVAVAGTPIETTARETMPVIVNNHEYSTQISADRTEFLESDEITVTAKSNFGDSIELVHNLRSVAKKIGRDAEFKIPAAWLGRGPVELEAIAIDENGKGVASEPLQLEILGSVSKVKRKTPDVK